MDISKEYIKEVLEGTVEVLKLNVELSERMIKERDEELLVWRLRNSN